MVVIIIWSLILVFFAWAAWAIKNEVKTYIKQATFFASKEMGFSFKYPSWWAAKKSQLKNHLEYFPKVLREYLDESIEPLLFYDPAGEGSLRVFALKQKPDIESEEDFREFLLDCPVEFDRDDVEKVTTRSFTGFELESRASMVISDEPQRRFVRFNLVNLPGKSLFWIYDCGVLAGLVDGVFLRKTLKSLKSLG